MARRIDAELERVEAVVLGFPDGVGLAEVCSAVADHMPKKRTVQLRLARLVELDRIVTQGRTRGMRYRAVVNAPRGDVLS